MTTPTETERLVRMETKLDMLVEMSEKRGLDHEARLRSLEQFKWVVMGIAAVVGGASGVITRAAVLG